MQDRGLPHRVCSDPSGLEAGTPHWFLQAFRLLNTAQLIRDQEECKAMPREGYVVTREAQKSVSLLGSLLRGAEEEDQASVCAEG